MTLEEEKVKKPAPNDHREFVELLRRLIHEMSQPLTSLQGSLELALLSELKVSECREVLQRSFAEVHRLAAGFATLREVLAAEDPGENFQHLNLKKLIRNVLKKTASAVRGKNVRFILGPLADAGVKVNPPRAEALLSGLLQQLIPRGDRKRTLRVGLSVREGVAELLICDAGQAVGEGVRPAAPLPTSKSVEGFQGAELAWWKLRRSIEAQGGTLEIERIPPRGLRCCLTLPLATADVAGADPV